MILPDSSAWIEAFRGTGSAVDLELTRLLDDGRDIAVTEPVIMELLAGARTATELRATRSRLLAFPMLRVDDLVTYERASAVWRACRASGEPVRNTIDCLIAAVAIREGATVLHADRDFDVIARHTDLRIEPLGW
ncbi:MAG: type II toxin-antitoxin system VapC family toxin [Actinomycetota bacterium]